MRGLLMRKWVFGSLGCLLALALFVWAQLWQATHCSPYDAVSANLHGLDMKIVSYGIDTHRRPASLLALLIDDGAPGWRGPYARAADLKDPWGGDVQYVLRADGTAVLTAHGRNRRVVTHTVDAMPAA